MINKESKLYDMVSNVGIFAIANIFVMLISVILTFILPKYLGVEDYGYWRLFGLYVGYAGFLHFGYNDGVFMNWLGKKEETIREEFVPQFIGLVFFQLIIVGICEVAVGMWHLSPQTKFVLQAFFLQALFLNLLSFLQFTCQALKDFTLVSIINVANSVILFVGIVSLLALGLNDFNDIVLLQILITFSIMLLAFIIVTKKLEITWGVTWNSNQEIAILKQNFKIGFFVLIGNFASVLCFSLDRLMASSHFTIKEFAVYSLAVSFVSVLYFLTSTISTVLLPYLVDAQAQQLANNYARAENVLILIWIFALGVYFPLKEFINWYLPNYTASLSLFRILLCGVVFGAIIQVLQANYFKTLKLYKMYALLGSVVISIYITLVIIILKIHPTLSALSFAAVVMFALWYGLNILVLRNKEILIPRSLPNIVGIMMMMALFLSIGSLKIFWLWEFTGYYIGAVIVTGVFFVDKKVTRFSNETEG